LIKVTGVACGGKHTLFLTSNNTIFTYYPIRSCECL